MRILSLDFYLRDDVVQISKELLGKFIYSRIGSKITGGRITETEAYRGIEDRACHAYGGKKTPRCEALYEKGGIAYVYICYGIHFLLNVVTNFASIPHAVLIRSIEPTTGVNVMLKRRNKKILNKTLTQGPGNVCQALGINLNHDKISFFGDLVWIEEGACPKTIISSPRIGVAYAKEDALLPWRFLAK